MSDDFTTRAASLPAPPPEVPRTAPRLADWFRANVDGISKRDALRAARLLQRVEGSTRASRRDGRMKAWIEKMKQRGLWEVGR